MSGQYAEQQKGDMEDSTAVPSQPSANATPSGTQFDLSNVTAEDVKAFVSSLYRQETPWALGCAAVMTSIWGDREVLKEASEKAASALTTLTKELEDSDAWRTHFTDRAFAAESKLKQMGDSTVPLVNGGASTTASGTPEFDDLDDEMLAVWLADNVLTKNENARRIISALRSVSKLKERLNRRHSGCACSFDEDDEIVGWCLVHAEYKKALQKIVSLDNDAHPGLSTWHDMRVQAHKEAETLLLQFDRTAPETSTRSADE